MDASGICPTKGDRWRCGDHTCLPGQTNKKKKKRQVIKMPGQSGIILVQR